MTSFNFDDLQRAHSSVHAQAAEFAAANPTPGHELVGGHPAQLVHRVHLARVTALDDVLARFIAYERKTIDADELDPNLAALIRSLI